MFFLHTQGRGGGRGRESGLRSGRFWWVLQDPGSFPGLLGGIGGPDGTDVWAPPGEARCLRAPRAWALQAPASNSKRALPLAPGVYTAVRAGIGVSAHHCSPVPGTF